ncbi:MAG: NADH-quinone oxidoreductase subunit NuoH [Planctomycetes bacterium]|nr:NADH-quinone oxidoreductase subunit NuoH [Planctomycetota bacterium]
MNAFLEALLIATVIITVLMTVTAWALWFERKFAARMQSRLGPTMVGKSGLLQPVADLLKLLQKEDILTTHADGLLFNLAPVLAAGAAIGAAAVVPFAPNIVGANLDLGVLFLLAIGAVTVLPVFAAGWGSNNKFALLGGMRAIAQSISYEVPLLLAALVPVILAGSMNLGEIVEYQSKHGWFFAWPFFLGIPAFVLFLLAMLAEANRIPFDIPEAESELVAGVTTEYTGMKFALFYMAEYVHTLVASAVAAALFLGGWDGPFAPGLHWMVAKTLALFVGVYWVRWTLLRFRSDQLMRIAWYFLVPTGVALVAGTAVWVVWRS